MKPADKKVKIQDANFRENLKAYLEDIIKEDLDDFKDKHVFENFNSIEYIFCSNINFYFNRLCRKCMSISCLRDAKETTIFSTDSLCFSIMA
jgi:nitrate reductase beta subunit